MSIIVFALAFTDPYIHSSICLGHYRVPVSTIASALAVTDPCVHYSVCLCRHGVPMSTVASAFTVSLCVHCSIYLSHQRVSVSTMGSASAVTESLCPLQHLPLLSQSPCVLCSVCHLLSQGVKVGSLNHPTPFGCCKSILSVCFLMFTSAFLSVDHC